MRVAIKDGNHGRPVAGDGLTQRVGQVIDGSKQARIAASAGDQG